MGIGGCRATLATFAVLVAGTLGLAPGAHAAQPLPVPYNAPQSFGGGGHPDEVAGANDFACKPSAAHPHPIVLVHGLAATLGTNWGTLSPLLKNNGFCVFGLTYGRQPGLQNFGGLMPMGQSAHELDAFVDKVLVATGAKQVDLLGHSEGTVMPRWYLSFLGGAPKVDKYVQLTPLWNGTDLAGIGELLAVGKAAGLEPSIYSTFAGVGCGSCPEFARGSAFMNKVNGAGPALPTIHYTEIATKNDELVMPYTSGLLDAPNVKNIVLQDVCPTDSSEHAAVAYSPVVAQLVLNALAPAQARPAACTIVTPLGTPSPPRVGLGPEPPVAASSGTATCARAAPLVVTLRPRRGERIRSVVVTSGGRTLAVRRGSALRHVTLTGVKPGRRSLRLRLRSDRGTRTMMLTRTFRCAAAATR